MIYSWLYIVYFEIDFLLFVFRLTSNLRALTYKYHLQNTYDINDWFEIYTFYSVTNDEREKEYALEALANTRWTFLFDLYEL